MCDLISFSKESAGRELICSSTILTKSSHTKKNPPAGLAIRRFSTRALLSCETWTLTAELQRRIQATEMRCYCKILRISYKDHVTNEEVRAKIQQGIGLHEDLLTIVKRHILQWYGHVSRSSGLAKTILQGTVKGGRRKGRQRKRREDNIRE